MDIEQIQGPERSRPGVPFGRRLFLVGLVIGLVAVSVSACGLGRSNAEPEKVSLARLSYNQEQYSGSQIITTGTVRRFGEGSGTHYVVEDAAHNRVEVQPSARVADHVGDEVTVTGRFSFSDTSGRTLAATSVRPAT